MKKILNWFKRKLSIASPSERWRKEGEYHLIMLTRIFFKVNKALDEAERTLNNEHRTDT